MSNDPLWINASAGAPAYSANELRQAMALPLMYGGRNVGARPGVRPGGTQLAVSIVGSTITVQPGLMCVDPGLSTPQGPYWVAISPAETHTLTAAHVSNPRKDIIIGRVYDNDEDSSGSRLARTEYIAGTAAASPSEPAVPTGAFRIATIDVPASGGGSPVVTQNHAFTVASGGLVPVRTQAERDLLTTFAYDGLACWRQDRDWIEVYDSAAWRVQGVGKVTSVGDLANITNPYSGQLAGNSADGGTYRYNGSAWAPLPGLIESQTLGSAAATVTFSSIPTGYNHLQLIVAARGSNASNFVELLMQFNGDTAGNYDSQQVVGSGSSALASETLADTKLHLGEFAAASAAAGNGGVYDICIPWHTSTIFHKYTATDHAFSYGTATSQVQAKQWTGRWRSTAAITSITLTTSAGNFITGSRFALLGRP